MLVQRKDLAVTAEATDRITVVTHTPIHEELARSLGSAEGDSLLVELFGTPDAAVAAGALLNVVGSIGRPIGVCLVRVSSGVVVGFDLEGALDRVVVKVHRKHLMPRLGSVLRAQRILGAAGIPVATPLVAAPRLVGSGAALIETWRADGESVDVRPSARRRAIARCSFAISGTLDADHFPDLVPTRAGRYPPPHSPVFDFEATSAGAEWIDLLADVALAEQAALSGVGRRVVAHSDLRPENVLLDLSGTDPLVSTVYDLDSLVVDAEPWLVGGTARAFSTNWSRPDPMLPTVSDIDGFVRDYEGIRGIAFSADETQLARVGALHALAYSARCEHAMFPDGSPAPWGPGWRSLLKHFAADAGFDHRSGGRRPAK